MGQRHVVDMKRILVNRLGKAIVLGRKIMAYTRIAPYTKTGIAPITFDSAGGALLSLEQTGKCEQASGATPSTPVNIKCNNGMIATFVDDELPFGCTRLQYIHVDGASYFDTGITPTTYDYEIETKCAFDVFVNGPNCMWGFMGAGTLPRWLLATYTNGYLLNANNTLTFNANAVDGNAHVFKGIVYKNNGSGFWAAYLDGEQRASSQMQNTQTWDENTLSIYLGARNNNGIVGNFVTGDIYYHKVTKGGVLIQNLIPCRNNLNVICFYDTVSGTFFTNEGSGSVTGGPEDSSHIVDICVAGIPEVISIGQQHASVEDLLGVGDYNDTHDIITGAVNRNVGIMILDGTEDWFLATDANFRQFYTTKTAGTIANSVSLMSNIAPYGCTASNRAQYQFGCYSGASGNLCFQMIGSDILTTINSWTDYLATKYAAKTPVIVVYPLTETVAESVSPQPISIAEGSCTISVAAEVSNVELKVTYPL